MEAVFPVAWSFNDSGSDIEYQTGECTSDEHTEDEDVEIDIDIDERDEERHAECFEQVPLDDVEPVAEWPTMSPREMDMLLEFVKTSAEEFQRNVKIAPLKGGRGKLVAWAEDYSGIATKEEYTDYTNDPYPPEILPKEDWFCCRISRKDGDLLYVYEMWLRFSGRGSLSQVRKFNAVLNSFRGIRHPSDMPRGGNIILVAQKFISKRPRMVVTNHGYTMA